VAAVTVVVAARTVAEAATMAAKAAGASMAMADIMATLGLLAENVTTKAAAVVVGQPRVITEWAAARTAGLELDAIQTH